MKSVLVIRPTVTTEITGEGDSEDEAKAAAMAQVPEGYTVLSLRYDR